MLHDVIIIGSGPAGISAALYTSRANLKTLIISKNDSMLKKAEKIENYFGFENPIRGEELLLRGENQAKRLGVEFVQGEVVSVEKENYFEVKTADMIYKSKAVLLATGQRRKNINIEGVQKFEGKGISYCATCDGFFYKGLKVGVLGYKDFALNEAIELSHVTKDITIFTNGMELELSDVYKNKLGEFKLESKPIQKFSGNDNITNVVLEDGTNINIDGIFIAYESASSIDFARKLGVAIEKEAIMVDESFKTNLEGFFAAGDCTGGIKQISVAVGQGAISGKSIIEYLSK